MNPYMAYDAVNTKIVSRRGHLLDKNEWEKYLGFSTVEQLTDYLKQKPQIKKILDDFKNDNIHRDSLEAILGKFKTTEIEDLIHYFSGPYKEFIKAMLIESEIADLSLTLRKIARGETLDEIEKRFVHSEKYTTISFDKLLTSNSVEKFTQNLQGTPYFLGLRNLSNEDALNREFHIEMKLQGVLYKTLLDKAENLRKDDMETAKDIFGYKIDLENIQWIYRAIKYYNISSEEILVYSLQGGKKITYNRLKALSYAKTQEEFRQLVISYLKYDLFKGVSDSTTDIGIDYHMFNYIKNTSYNNIGSSIAYIYILSIVIDDLTSITEGIKYDVPREKLKDYLAYRI